VGNKVSSLAILLLLATALAGAPEGPPGRTLEEQLRAEKIETLVREAFEQGDPVRGAIVFYQPYLTCAKCHTAGEEAAHPLGPDLARLEKEIRPAQLIEAILDPSKVIRKGFEPVTLLLKNGQTINGILVEQNAAAVVLRDIAREGQTVKVSRDEIDELTRPETSIMPAGLVNQLGSRQQFLDLAAYLAEISAKGPSRALALKPAPALYALPPLPGYEQHLDHAGLITDLDSDSFDRGAAIYKRVCANCHGTHEQPGSLPTSLRFASGKFKNGADPYAMYQTLTRGFGLMVPQTWMVPQQKYDVVHYLREAYLKSHNPAQYTSVNEAYLSRLPRGDTRGPAPSSIEPWVAMDYGPHLVNTYEIGDGGANFAYKGIAMRLDPGPGGVSRGRDWMIFDHDTLRVAAAWQRPADSKDPPFIDWRGIHFDGQHSAHPRVMGDVLLANPTGPGWADPETGTFDDPRLRGRDGRSYGPLPRTWARYKGIYVNGPQTVISYSIGTTPILELASIAEAKVAEMPATLLARTFHVGPRAKNLHLAVATESGSHLLIVPVTDEDRTGEVALFGAPQLHADNPEHSRVLPVFVAGVAPPLSGAIWSAGPTGRLILTIPSGKLPLKFTLWHSRAATDAKARELAVGAARAVGRPADLEKLTHGGLRRWPEVLTTQPVIGDDAGPFAVDVLTHPANNPWLAQLRLTGFDFFDDGDRAAVCSWDGDVWLVKGLNSLPSSQSVRPKPAAARPVPGRTAADLGRDATGRPAIAQSKHEANLAQAAAQSHALTWQRIASGLFQPLGLKIVGGKIHVTCRDQLVILHDFNGDEEIDFYENFNNDHQVTEHFHEFAMGLQVDRAGNFYYAKSARHALPAVVPHHGTLLRVSPDGTRTDILATGFRAANGVCLNSDGTFIVTDQEGHWNPKNRINWVKPGGFYGNMFGYHNVTDSSDAVMEQPVCWITNSFDRSPAELVWVPADHWGPLGGSLLNLSYGYGKIYVVPHERVDGQWQGGMCELPVPAFPTGIMRGRFHPHDGALYVCGMYAWAGNATQAGGFYRVRSTGRPTHVPLALHARKSGLAIVFAAPLERSSTVDRERYAVKVWNLERTAKYGSEHYDEEPLVVKAVSLSDDGRTVALDIPKIRPTRCMEIRYFLRGADGSPVNGTIHNTIHHLSE
jgi:putative heme-binding domain-containing protein